MLQSGGFKGKEGKATMGGYSEQIMIESHFGAACTGKLTCSLFVETMNKNMMKG